MDNKEGNAGLRREGVLGFGGSDKAHGNADDRGGQRHSLVEHFEQSKQRRRRIADGDDGAFQMRPPKLQRRGRSGVSDFEQRVARRLRSSSVQMTLLFAGNLLRVMP